MPVTSVQSLACITLGEESMLDVLAMDLLLSGGARDLWRISLNTRHRLELLVFI